MKQVIGFSGKLTSGKSEAAKTLVAHLGDNAKVFSFAYKLKEMAVQLFPVTWEQVLHRKTDVIKLGERELTIRTLLIELGTKMREIEADFWIRQLWEQVDPYQGIAVIDDVRYVNEAKFLEGKSGQLIRVEREGVQLIDDPSETQLDKYPFKKVIINASSLDDLKRTVVDMYEKELTPTTT